MNPGGPKASTAGTSREDVSSARETSALFDDSSFFANISAAAKSPGSRADRSADVSALNVSALCCDEEFSGFDRLSGRTWIYPTNYPVRDYQFNIIKATILQNTLVSLPTGLGKTFIAAVIMYNFYRWYPLGKIVFTAPTRPLVAQQIDACYNVVAIPRADTIEMTGHMQVATRKIHWKEKRVFFATPQVIYNDLKSGICPAERVRCLVFDEAHRARGNYAYCQIMSALADMGHRVYRVLALSATPGSKVEDVVNVVRSLQIAHLELRTESCIDVARYSHSKRISTVVVPLGPELTHLRQQYVEILDTYARRLKQLNILGGNVGNLSKGRIVMLYKDFQARDRGARHPQHNQIMRDFTVLISLYHGLELLARHGSRVFLNFFDEHAEKGWMQADDRLTALLERLRDDLGVNPLALDRSTLPDGTVAEIPKDITFGHPKFDHLRKILTKHFTESREKGAETKAIVFCEYRESVHLVHCLLLQCRPLVQPQMFVGQGAGGKEGGPVVSQKAQMRVMRQFREGACNVLVATCVAEEGLDVGSVDLIVCFDISTRSPVRLVQRCGRTGRERGGQVYILVTEGREHQTLQECMRQRDNLNGRILQSRDVHGALYRANPRMLPQDITPQCQKMHITVKKLEVAEKPQRKSGQRDLRSMLTDRQTAGPAAPGAGAVSGIISREELETLFPAGLPRDDHFGEARELWACSVDELKRRAIEPTTRGLNLSEWLEWQRALQSGARVGHSSDSRVLSELLQYADAKRFSLPPDTQHPNFNTQMLNTQALLPPPEPKKKTGPAKKKAKPNPEPTRRDGDIRALFSTTKKSTKEYTKVVKDLGIDNAGGLPTSLIDLMVDLCVQDDRVTTAKCKMCEHILDCGLLHRMKNDNDKKVQPPLSILKNFDLPNIDLLDNIDFKFIQKAALNISDTNQCTEQSSEDVFFDDLIITDNLFPKEPIGKNEVLKEPLIEKDNMLEETEHNTARINCTSNFDLEFDFDFDESDIEESKEGNILENNVSANNFDVGGLEDIFMDSNSPLSVFENKDESETTDKKENPKEALEFFGLDSIDDIFADSNDDDIEVVESCPPESKLNDPDVKSPTYTEDPVPRPIQVNGPSSPSLLSGARLINDTIVCSPIICSQRNTFTLNKNTPVSPILCSQRNRLSLNKSYSAKSSTPLSTKPKSLFNTPSNTDIINVDDNSVDWAEIKDPTENASNKTGNDTTGSKSLFTITQLIDIINKPTSSNAGQNSSKNIQNISNVSMSKRHAETKSTSEHEDMARSDTNRSLSPIIFTQADLCSSAKTNLSKSESTKDQTIESNNNLRSSPIIFTQRDRRTLNTIQSRSKAKPNITADTTLVILDSDSDDTVAYSPSPVNNVISPKNRGNVTRAKRKLELSRDDSICSSPYFSKRQKCNNSSKPSLSLKDKLKSIFSNNKKSDNSNNPDIYRATVSEMHFQKENRSPNKPLESDTNGDLKQMKSISFEDFDFEFEDDLMLPNKSPQSKSQKNPLEKLQIFKRDTGKSVEKNNGISNGIMSQIRMKTSREMHHNGGLSDSDDDFLVKDKKKPNRKKDSPVVNYKVRKKKKRACEFLDLSAELSGGSRDSGDEMSSDDSLAGSIVDFICDETHHDAVDMQGLYLRSVKNPVNGMFKIPHMPHRLANVLSQPDRNDDDYEIDSFCVDGDVGLTQAQDVSELELAERRLERRQKLRKNRPKLQQPAGSGNWTADSPVARPRQIVRRQISSESGSDND